MIIGFPKTEYVRSAKLMMAYRSICCQHCNADDGTVCGAHSNSAADGKGRSIKASDDKCASLCAKCHSMVDSSYSLSGAERRAIWLRAHEKTVALLKSLDRWPL